MGKLKSATIKEVKDNGLFASSVFMENHADLFRSLENTSPHEYSKIMDKVYNDTHIGGGFHRTFDGSHTLKGSYDAIKNEVGEVDLTEFFKAHFRELVTPEGIPIMTLDKQQYENLSNEISETLGGILSPGDIRSYFRDINSVNAGEVCASGLGLVFTLAAIRSGDEKAISRVIASNLCLGIATANPLQLLFGVCFLAHGVYNGKIKSYELLKGAAPAIMGIIGYQTANKLFGFGKGGCIVFSIGTAVASNMLIEHMDKKNREQIIEELGEDNPGYITAMTPDILGNEFAKLSRRLAPTGLGKLV